MYANIRRNFILQYFWKITLRSLSRVNGADSSRLLLYLDQEQEVDTVAHFWPRCTARRAQRLCKGRVSEPFDCAGPKAILS
jgi:hypothetical protein